MLTVNFADYLSEYLSSCSPSSTAPWGSHSPSVSPSTGLEYFYLGMILHICSTVCTVYTVGTSFIKCFYVLPAYSL